MAVFDGDDRVFEVAVGQRVYDDLAVGTELQGDAVRDLAQHIQRKLLTDLHERPFLLFLLFPPL